jgi:aminopeptidase YwaD
MFRKLLEAVRVETSGERAHEWVRAIAGHHRVQASPGYDAAAEWLRGALVSLGLEPEWETVSGDGHTRAWQHLLPEGWACDRAHAALVDDTGARPLCDFARQPLSLIQRSDPARGRYPLMALADGTEDAHYAGVDVRGCVVLTSGAVQRVHQLAVVERGAAGILADGRRLFPPVRDADTDSDAINYTSFWWSGNAPRGWGFVVSPRMGAGLRERLANGAALSLDLEIETRRFATAIPLLSTRIPGEAPGEVLVMAHLCHPFACANDNASGVAAALETARVLKTLASRGVLPATARSVRMLWMPELTGTYAWLAAHPPRTRALTAALNLDMVGEDQDRCGSTQLLEHPPCFAASFAEELMAAIRPEAADRPPGSLSNPPVPQLRMAEVPFAGGSDHVPFLDPAVAIPCPMLIQWPDRYYHSSSDTPDKTDPRSLAHAVRCAATYAGVLAGAVGAAAEELITLTRRGARIRLLSAVGAADPVRAVARERVRGDRALASLARLGVAETRITSERDAFAAFAETETGPGRPWPVFSHPLATETPRRTVQAPLHYQRFLLPGWSALPRAEREAWRRVELDTPDGELLADLGWAACDGRRTLGEISGLVWLETGRDAIDLLAATFTHAAHLGLAEIGSPMTVPPGGAT